MESKGYQLKQQCCDADKRSGWGWLAAAALAGLMVARRYPKGGLALGLGLTLWKCCGERGRAESVGQEAEEVVESVGQADERADEVVEEEEAQGGWLLNLEPVPLVVRENATPINGQGQGDDLLGQGPGKAVEVFDWQVPEGSDALWINEGAEIPDTVELPELGETSEPRPSGQSGV